MQHLQRNLNVNQRRESHLEHAKITGHQPRGFRQIAVVNQKAVINRGDIPINPTGPFERITALLPPLLGSLTAGKITSTLSEPIFIYRKKLEFVLLTDLLR